MAIERGDAPDYTCPVCRKDLGNEWSFDNHVIAHATEGEWPNASIQILNAAMARMVKALNKEVWKASPPDEG